MKKLIALAVVAGFLAVLGFGSVGCTPQPTKSTVKVTTTEKKEEKKIEGEEKKGEEKKGEEKKGEEKKEDKKDKE
jgi:hypothetical protein